jgi:hypothetical protein
MPLLLLLLLWMDGAGMVGTLKRGRASGAPEEFFAACC